jgi:hypothetical protein
LMQTNGAVDECFELADPPMSSLHGRA